MVRGGFKKSLWMSLFILLGSMFYFSSAFKDDSGSAYAGAKGPSMHVASGVSAFPVSTVDLEPVSKSSPQPQPQQQSFDDEIEALQDEDERSVQVILTDAKSAVISGTMDGVMVKLPFENGDKFKKGAVLAEYECRMERAKIEEINARIRLSDRQLAAYDRLKELDAVADIEYLSVAASNAQEKALLTQAQARASLCVIKAPFDGRVKDKMASNYESVRSGRVLMEITSSEPLQVEALVPSVWLRWLNNGSDLSVYINESDKVYKAKIVRVHGQVDPVTQTAHVVAQIDGYKEELLPGMSGRATFERHLKNQPSGFLGLSLGAK